MTIKMVETITSDRHVSGKILGLIAVLLGQFMLVLDATVVNVALPAMQADLGVAPGELTWITNAYLIAFGGLLLLFGRLGDRIGRRRVFVLGVELFTLASIACGFASNAPVLIAARFVQGIGAAGASSVILAIIATEFPRPADRAKAMSGYAFVSVSGGSLGLFVGGLLTQALSWHWIFWINVPFGALALALVRRYLRAEPPAATRAPIDVIGAVLVTVTAMTAIYGFVEAGATSWDAPAVRGALALAIALAVVFVTLEAARPHPLLPLRVFRIRGLVVTSVVRGFMAMGLYGVFFLATLDMSHTLGFAPLHVGLAFLPQTLTVAALSLGGSAALVQRFGAARVLVAGLAIAAAGVAIMAGLAVDEPYLPIRLGAHLLLGLGFGLAFLPLLTLAMADVPAHDAGLGSAIINLSLQLAAAVDIALLVTASSHRTRALLDAGAPLRDATVLGYRFAYQVALAGMLVGLTLAATLLRPNARARSAERLAS
ncbi:MAG TPA: DHA2 family efflux MFS transporter permease subunit [Kofleriaceae bacterium]|nr:DHA2 family efflux MFS transporter permease subunit [Kofleriaceae bacterium]